MKKRITSVLTSTKTKIMASIAVIMATVAPTFCEDLPPQLEKASNLIINIVKWGGRSIALIGAIMVGKAAMDAYSGQNQPGALPKAMGVLVLGVLMMGASWVVSYLG